MEIWKDIVGFEGLYRISNKGRVFSMGRIDRMKRVKPAQYLSLSRYARGYLGVSLSDENSVKKMHQVHRLVAIAFIPNKDNKPCVNHKNGIKWDNRVENLEWVTYSENNKHSFDTGLKNPSINRGVKSGNSKKVKCLDTGKIYSCIREASEDLGINYGTLVSMLNGARKNKTNMEMYG